LAKKEKYYLTTLNKHLPKAGEKWGTKYSGSIYPETWLNGYRNDGSHWVLPQL